jgi:flavodoxin
LKSLVLYETQYGNTKQVAEAIGGELQADGPVRVAPIGDFTPSFLEGVDLLLLGGPTQAHGVTQSMSRFLRNLEVSSGGVRAAAFDTRIKGPAFLWGSAATEIETKLRAAGFKVVSPVASFLVTLAREPVLHDGEQGRAAEWARQVVNVVHTELGVAV